MRKSVEILDANGENAHVLGYIENAKKGIELC
jgi:hypothetical protein